MVDQGVSLLCRMGGCVASIPIGHVSEILRPLPVEPLQGFPGFVQGLSILRGQPVPVVDGALLLGDTRPSTSTRWVALRMETRRMALATGAVLGVRTIDGALGEGLSPLSDQARPEFLDSIGVLDSRLLVVLRAARILPEETWQRLSSGTMAS